MKISRRDSLRGLILTLLTLIFGERVIEILQNLSIPEFEEIEFKITRYYQIICTRPCDNVVITW